MDARKIAVAAIVDGLGDQLEPLSHRIHQHPELAFEEVRACRWLSEFLGAHGLEVEAGVGGIATAFRASVGHGDGPTVAILCEYDALPEIGHACGHNVIAAAGAGAGAALAALPGRPAGRIQVIGTPAEEGGGGKIKLLEAGVFRGVDCAMMIHGFDRTVLHQDLLGVIRAGFTFTGTAAHASADPWAGVNALDACVQTFSAIAMLRQQMRPDCRVHGVITDGGAAPDVVAERAAASLASASLASASVMVRAPSLEGLWTLYRRVVACAEGAARATGARLDVTPDEAAYAPMNSSATLLELFGDNLRELGMPAGDPMPDRVASSDIGNVSQVVPTIHPWIAIAPAGTAIHTRDFREGAAGPLARAGLIGGAKALAMTALDLLSDPGRVARASAELGAR